MSASSRPPSVTRSSRAETTPRVKFEPVGLVNTFRPRFSNTLATIRVVVVLPLVPETSTTPSGSWPSVRARKPGSMVSAILPGNALPPECASRAALRTALPISGVAKACQGRRVFASTGDGSVTVVWFSAAGCRTADDRRASAGS